MSGEVSYENGRLVVTRTFKAPRPAVFNAWIKTSKVELWWGCGYANQVKSTIEPKIGGDYHHRMTLKNVGDYQQHGLITEYDPPAVLAYELIDPMSDVKMLVRVVFTEKDNITTVRLTHDNLPDAHHEFVQAGWVSALEGLAYLLQTGRNPRERSFSH